MRNLDNRKRISTSREWVPADVTDCKALLNVTVARRNTPGAATPVLLTTMSDAFGLQPEHPPASPAPPHSPPPASPKRRPSLSPPAPRPPKRAKPDRRDSLVDCSDSGESNCEIEVGRHVPQSSPSRMADEESWELAGEDDVAGVFLGAGDSDCSSVAEDDAPAWPHARHLSTIIEEDSVIFHTGSAAPSPHKAPVPRACIPSLPASTSQDAPAEKIGSRTGGTTAEDAKILGQLQGGAWPGHATIFLSSRAIHTGAVFPPPRVP
ncbi:hypothetical protein B0J12DRAFT_790026 [Macrophomina phaseolina]|uniref:Uncharacterized protein n=1 Tax=Macrophomina phaseolina TaxID=35725 RepID=A0ABQ8FU54_9PEZI|nr:hypothetical protein B0J12DRAFT_790026 [Macrophomina phaseolina]